MTITDSRGKQVDDKRKEELEKLSIIIDALENMSPTDRARILKTVAAFYGIQ